MIVTVTPTVMSGQVVRWFATESQAEHGAEILSASRDGVWVHTYLHLIAAEQLDAANAAYGRILRGEDVGHLATHERGRFGVVSPIERAKAG